jgi:gliding motility-associated-like protein
MKQFWRSWVVLILCGVGLGWAQVDSTYIRMKELGISPAPAPWPPGVPQPLTNPASDCPGAIRICQATYTFAQAVPNAGNIQELPGGAGTCLLGGEHRSVWFIFTIQQGGTLGFIIDPGSSTDYDFAMWDVTGLTNPCSAIGSQPPIRCNFSGSTTTTSCCGGYNGGPGITGLDHTTTQAGNLSYGAGDPPVMPGLTVTAGQTFLLVVDNWTNNNQGYNITFTGTAQYFDNTPPKMDSTGQLCASSYDNQIDYLRQVFVRFSELINPTTVAANGSDFVVQDVASGTLVSITAAVPINPPQTNQVGLTVGSPLVPGQTYKIRIGYNPPGSGSSNGQPGSDGNTIGDQCGITIPITNIPQGSSADSIVLVVRDTLTPTISVTPPTCVGAATGQISVSTTGGVSPYQYMLVSGTSNTPPNTGWNASGTFTNRAAGTYTLWIRDAAGCIIRRVIQLTDPPALSIVVTDSRDIVCGSTDGYVTFTGQGGTPPYEYSILPTSPTWQNGNTFTGLAAGTYTLRVRDANGCVATRSFTITALPPLTVQVSSVDSIRCAGGTGGFTVQASGGTAPYTYTLVGLGTTSSTGTFTGLPAGTYTVRAFDAPQAQCGDITITLTQPDTLKLQDSTVTPVTCRGGQNGQIQVTITGGTSPYTYTWQTAGGDSLPSMGSTVSGLTAGTYTLTVTDAKGCLLGPITFTVPYSYFVEIDSIAYTLVQDCPDKNYLFSAYVRGDGPFTYRWTWEDGSTEVGSATISRSYSPLLQGDVTIRLQVEGAGPCYAEASLTFLSKACSGLVIPTAFTPNGDGINDIWNIQAIGFSRYTLIVFDRWGKEVFNNGGDMTKQWNGTINGQPAPEGVYNFVFEGTRLSGEKVTRAGTVTLLR